MSYSKAEVKTENASQYLQQLSRHWGRKFKVEFTPEKSVIDFGEGKKVRLFAGDKYLETVIESFDKEGLPKLEQVVEEHIKRFAFKENLEFEWLKAAA